MTTRPVVDHGQCEAKRACVQVCPYGVFEVRRIDAEDFAALGMLARLRATAHRRMTAYPVRADRCQEWRQVRDRLPGGRDRPATGGRAMSAVTITPTGHTAGCSERSARRCGPWGPRVAVRGPRRAAVTKKRGAMSGRESAFLRGWTR